MSNRLRGLFLFFLVSFLFPVPANAQTGSSATLSPPATDGFPRIQTYLNVHDDQDNFIGGLKTSHVQILEDNNPLPVIELEELRPGVQLVIALNPGPYFGLRNAKGTSRYDFIKQTLQSWAQSRQGSTLDDWSLLVTNGPTISHISDPALWLTALGKDLVDARTAVPSLDTLSHAVSLAADQTIRPGMGRAVLWITPPPDAGQVDILKNLTDQAIGQGVTIFIWMVSSQGAYNTESYKQLTQLAEKTGGKFFTYTGDEPPPNPEEYLEPLRHIYNLVYLSKINSSGTHTLTAQVLSGTEKIETNSLNFDFNILPPQPAFVAPLISIQRKLAASSNVKSAEGNPAPILTPKEQALQVVFDFPDGRKRPLVQSSLLIDGKEVAENKEPPFDQFTWNLEPYTTNGIHQIQVQAKDVFGLTGTSIEIPVQISVEQTPVNAWSIFQGNIPLLSLLAVLLAGALLLLVLLLGGKLRPRAVRATHHWRRKADPLTQSVQVRVEPPAHRLSNWVNRLQWPQRQTGSQSYAFLCRLSEPDNLPIPPTIPITSDEITFGSDPSLATIVLDDPCIEGLHARITRELDGSFHLADEGSIAGTWINYTPVSHDGAKLEHGDLLNIGRIAFRFTLQRPAQVRKPVVTLKNPPDVSTEESQE